MTKTKNKTRSFLDHPPRVRLAMVIRWLFDDVQKIKDEPTKDVMISVIVALGVILIMFDAPPAKGSHGGRSHE